METRLNVEVVQAKEEVHIKEITEVQRHIVLSRNY